MIGKTNASAGGLGRLPKFTYTGQYRIVQEDKKNWKVKYLTSGTLTLKTPAVVDVFGVGGGGGAGDGGGGDTGHGGGGGYTKTIRKIVLEANKNYSITIGPGGGPGSRGGTTSISQLGFSVGGGYPGAAAFHGTGGSGGSGGAARMAGRGGNDGGNAPEGGSGQGTTTREFGEPDGQLYAGGAGSPPGYGAGGVGQSGKANTGGGGGGDRDGQGSGNSGGSGILVIRNARGIA